jgi:SAM-dependent methyltransferase
MGVGELPDYVLRNRVSWDGWARDYEEPGRLNWTQDEPLWGIWGVPESQLRVLPDDVAGLDVIELGCGTGYVSAWLARRGARPVGIDNSEAQLRTASAFQREFGLEFPLLYGNAEDVPLSRLDHIAGLLLVITPVLIWRSPSTARASGATRTDGSPRPRGCYAPKGN